MRGVPPLGLLLCSLWAGCAGGTEGDYAFRSASSVAIRHASTFTGSRYERGVLLDAYRERALPGLRRCVEQLGGGEGSRFAVVFVIAQSGQVAEVYLDRDSEVGRCFSRELRGVVFPPPPFDRFHQQVVTGPRESDVSQGP